MLSMPETSGCSTVRQTSLNSFFSLDDIGVREIYAKILLTLQKEGAMTDRELAAYLGYSDPNIIRPRRHELMHMGKLHIGEIVKCKVSGKKAYNWEYGRW